jgi:hypothetical protein
MILVSITMDFCIMILIRVTAECILYPELEEEKKRKKPRKKKSARRSPSRYAEQAQELGRTAGDLANRNAMMMLQKVALKKEMERRAVEQSAGVWTSRATM